MSEASYLLRARAALTPPRSTSRSNPTRVSTAETTLAIAFAMSQPTIKMMRKTTNFGTKVATLDQALDTPVPKLTDASGMIISCCVTLAACHAARIAAGGTDGLPRQGGPAPPGRHCPGGAAGACGAS